MAFSNLAVSFPRFSLRRCIGKKGKNNSNLKETPTAACRQGEPHSTTLHHTAHSLAGTWDEAQSTGEFCSFNSCSPLLCHPHRAETTQKGIHPLALTWCQCALGKIGQLVPMANTIGEKQVRQLRKENSVVPDAAATSVADQGSAGLKLLLQTLGGSSKSWRCAGAISKLHLLHGVSCTHYLGPARVWVGCKALQGWDGAQGAQTT